MSLSENYPDIRPVWMNDYSNAGVIDPRCSFTRSDSTPSNVHYWSDEDHLSSENLLLDSKTGTANWTGDSSGSALVPVVTANYAASPDGTASQATRVQLDLDGNTTGSDYARYYQAHNVASGTSATFAVWMKSTDGASSYAAQILSPAGPGVAVTITGSWQKFTVTADSFGNIAYGVRLRGGQTPTNADTADVLVWGANLSTTGQTVLSETTTQIHREYAATLKSVAYSGQPRFEYEPAGDRSARGILIEGQFTQHLLRTEEFDNASWVKTNSTVQSNASIAPSGELTADLLVESDDTVASSHFAKQSFTPASGVSYTYSFFAKAAGRTNVRVQGVFGGINGYADVNLSTKVVSGGTGSINNVTATDVGNGWVRVEAVIGPTTGTGGGDVYVWLNDGSGITYTGNGYSGVLLWGANLTQSSHSYSYLKAEGAATTKAAESLSVATADIGYTGGDFTVIAEANMPGDNVGNVVEVGDGTSSNRATLQARTDGSQGVTIVNAGSVQAYIGNTSARNAKRAMRVANDNFGYCESGGTVATDTAGVVPVTSTLYVGKGYSGSELNGHIKRVALYSEALSATELQSLTS